MSAKKSRRMILDARLKADRDYWIKKVSREIGPSNLALDFERPAHYSGAKGVVEMPLPTELSAKLIMVSGGSEFLLYTFLLTVLKACLKRYTGSDSVIIGSPGLRDDDLETQESNVLPIVADINSGASFKNLLMQVKETLTEGYARQDYPFDRLLRDLGIESEQAGCPLFDIVCILENIHVDLPDLKNDITMVFTSAPDIVRGRIEYNSSLFDEEKIERFAAHYARLLRDALDNIDAPICMLEIFTEAERHQLLAMFNDTRTDFGPDQCVHYLFEDQAAATPDAIALVFDGEHITYGKLNERANKLGHHLRKLGAGPDIVVGLCLERSPDAIIGLLGVLKAGGAYLPLNPSYPQERLSFIIDDSRVRIIGAQSHLLDALPECAASVVCIDRDWGTIAVESGDNLDRQTEAKNLAYVIYTSGSTGNPKGTLIEHRGVCNLAHAQNRAFRISAGSHVLQFASMSFDASVSEIFTTLTCGATLHLERQDTLSDAYSLMRALEEQAITTVTLPPALLSVLPERDLPALETLVVAGESCPASTAARWSAGRYFINAYGPTENSVCASLMQCDQIRGVAPPIGRPIANTQVYMLDGDLNPVPVGVVAELYIGGIGLARGYLNRADLTAEKFIPDRFSDSPGSRLYRSGDLARYLPDANIEYIGRVDNQVKIRGFRVELGEIESFLNQHPAIKKAVVATQEDELGNKNLVAYLIPDSEAGFTVTDQQLYQLPNDLRIAHINKNETDFLYKELFEDETYIRHGITLRADDCVFDVGANIGLFTLYVQQKCVNGFVYAFEPIPPTFEILSKNVSFYKTSAKIFNCGLSDEARSAVFNFYPEFSMGSGFYTDQTDLEAQTYLCELKTLSDVINEDGVEQIDLLKIDVEGSELDVLLGIKRRDWRKIKQVVIEVENVDGRLAKITALLESNGFDIVAERYDLSPEKELFNVYALHPTRALRPQEEPRAQSASRLSPIVISLSEFRRYLQEKLPDYMVPTAFALIDELPLTSNGKIDFRALPLPGREAGKRVFMAPRTPMEKLVAQIWEETLNIPEVSIHDNFFELGGHSLLATQVVSRLREVFPLELPVRILFDAPTLSEFCLATVQYQAEQFADADIDQLLAEIEHATDDRPYQ